MSDKPKNDDSHQVLSDMKKHDVEQPGDSPSDSMPQTENSGEKTEDAPRIDD